jgi:hypothetical protein
LHLAILELLYRHAHRAAVALSVDDSPESAVYLRGDWPGRDDMGAVELRLSNEALSTRKSVFPSVNPLTA